MSSVNGLDPFYNSPSPSNQMWRNTTDRYTQSMNKPIEQLITKVGESGQNLNFGLNDFNIGDVIYGNNNKSVAKLGSNSIILNEVGYYEITVRATFTTLGVVDNDKAKIIIVRNNVYKSCTSGSINNSSHSTILTFGKYVDSDPIILEFEVYSEATETFLDQGSGVNVIRVC